MDEQTLIQFIYTPESEVYETDLYFEAHVTTDPIADGEADMFEAICAKYEFRRSPLLIEKTLKPHVLDAFTSTRSKDYTDILQRTKALMSTLMFHGFVIRRYKIENTILDSRHPR